MAFVVACDASDVDVLVPADVELQWDASFNGANDGLAAVVPVDVMVYRTESGDPVDRVEIELTTNNFGAAPLSADHVAVTEPERCDGECDLVWDAYRDRYFELGPASDDGVLRVMTDATGLARVAVVVDVFDEGVEGFEPIAVSAALGQGDEAHVFYLIPR